MEEKKTLGQVALETYFEGIEGPRWAWGEQGPTNHQKWQWVGEAVAKASKKRLRARMAELESENLRLREQLGALERHTDQLQDIQLKAIVGTWDKLKNWPGVQTKAAEPDSAEVRLDREMMERWVGPVVQAQGNETGSVEARPDREVRVRPVEVMWVPKERKDE